MCGGDSMHWPNLIPYTAHFKLTLSTTAIYVSVDYISLWGRCHLPHSGRIIIPKSDCVQASSRWQCFLISTKLIWITAPQPEIFFHCHISAHLGPGAKGAQNYTSHQVYFCWRHACPLSLFSTPSDLTKVYTLPRRLNPWPRLTQFHSCLSRLWLIIFKHVSPGYVITTLHICPERTSQGMEGLSTWAKSLVTASNTFTRNLQSEAEGFLSLSVAKLSDTW